MDEFFLKALPGGKVSAIVVVLSIVSLSSSLWRRQPSVWLLVATFLPLNAVAWLMLDVYSVSRYGVGYAPMYGVLAAHGVGVLAETLRQYAARAQITIVLLIAARYAYWTGPAILQVRSSASPPVAAMTFLRSQSDPKVLVNGRGQLAVVATEQWLLHGRRAVVGRRRHQFSAVARTCW